MYPPKYRTAPCTTQYENNEISLAQQFSYIYTKRDEQKLTKAGK